MATPAPLSPAPPFAGLDAFLARHGWSDATVRPLEGDASFRRYARVLAPRRSAILMDAPPPAEDTRPFLHVARGLAELGFATPRIYAAEPERGLLLLEDFGDLRMNEVLADDPSREEAVYAAAVDLLLALHGHAPLDGLAPYDRAVYRREADLLVDWYAPALDLPVDRAGYAAAWDAVLAGLPADGRVTVLRDYHAENIMLLPRGGGALGLLDFQDALAGHPAYDLVSLLQDARREVAPALEATMLARYRAARPLDQAAYAILGAQRNAKILGIFCRLWKRDGKDRYLGLQPRVWRYLERDLAHPALAPVARWFEANLPAASRAAAWGGALA
jgi:N-acetylmuramate 1-kinase